MSAIAGLYHLSGQPVAPEALARMGAALAYRGPDRAGAWHDGPVGLVHRALYTTPEAHYKRLPLSGAGGRFVLTADARLDNREELSDRFGLRSSTQAAPVTDADLILAAYAEWGRGCPEKLLGAFAFAVWDKAERQLFCARDHFGVKPFYYVHAPGRLFAFGSEIKALFALGEEVSRKINEERISDYLTSVILDNEYTFYEHVRRLPPAHTLTVSRDAELCRAYWTLDPPRDAPASSPEKDDAAYAEGFRTRFAEAVRCRLRGAPPPAAYLSGGLDSSSIVCVARDALAEQQHAGGLHTFSNTYERFPVCDERFYMEQVVGQGGITPHYVPTEDAAPLQALKEMLHFRDEAFFAPNAAAGWRLGKVMRAAGVRVVLDGHGGDEVVSHGYGRLKTLARSGRWLALAREVHGVAQVSGAASPAALLQGYIWKFGFLPFVRKHRPLRAARNLWNEAVASLRGASYDEASALPVWRSVVNHGFAQRVDARGRCAQQRRDDPRRAQTEGARHLRVLTSPRQPYSLETLDGNTAAQAIEGRYPFWDKRLVEFCLALPSDQKLRHGWERYVLRQAMRGTLPRSVRRRRDKTNFLPILAHGLARDRASFDVLFAEPLERLDSFVNPPHVRTLYRSTLEASQPSSQDLFMVWRIAALTLWLHLQDEQRHSRGQALPPEPEVQEAGHA